MDSNLVAALVMALGRAVQRLLRPARSGATLGIGAAGDLTRTRSELLAENALLRQQVIVLRRSIGRPRLHRDHRLVLLALARLNRRWRDTLRVVSPETLLRWHRDLFKIIWRRKSRPPVTATFSGIFERKSAQGFRALGFSGDLLRNDAVGDPAPATILTLTGLPPHESISIEFLLAVIETWDGSCGPNRVEAGGALDSDHCPDFFNVAVDGVNVFEETFFSLSATAQSYVETRETLLSRFVDLGFGSEGDLAYDMGMAQRLRNIAHDKGTLTVSFYSSGAGWRGVMMSHGVSITCGSSSTPCREESIEGDAAGLLSRYRVRFRPLNMMPHRLLSRTP